jgi:hypothetical protein
MQHLPIYVHLLFVIATLTAVAAFYLSSKSRKFLLIILVWIIVQSIISVQDFYTISNTLPPRFALLILPPAVASLFLFFTREGKLFLDKLDIRPLILLQAVRIPVEIGLFYLYVHKTVPELMTFHGRNFDILAGITAPLVYYFAFIKNKLNPQLLLAWNVLCLLLLSNIIFHGVLSAPTLFQHFAFDQPNLALMHFPFTWLPGVLVPLVYISHFAIIRRLRQILARDKKAVVIQKIYTPVIPPAT